MTKQRLKPIARKVEILDAALDLSAKRGYLHVTRDEIAEAVGVTGPAVQYHFNTMDNLRRALMEHAVTKRCAPVVAQGLAVFDPAAADADADLRKEAGVTLMG